MSSAASSASSSAVATPAAASADVPAVVYPPISAAARAAGKVTIVGFGSLLSARSASSTFPELSNFRAGAIKGYRRVFAHVAAIFIERGIANVETKEMSSLSVEPAAAAAESTLLVSVFEIPLSALPAFYVRETEFQWMHVPVYGADSQTVDSRAVNGEGLLCAAFPSDDAYRALRLGNSEEAWREAYGRWGVERVWRDDLLPCPVYLRHCVLAAAGMDRAFFSASTSSSAASTAADANAAGTTQGAGAASSNPTPPAAAASSSLSLPPPGPVLDNFLDCTFLGDRVTTVRQYLATRPDIMQMQPPECFRDRYSG